MASKNKVLMIFYVTITFNAKETGHDDTDVDDGIYDLLC
jgi:hypothetical protein